MQQGVWRGPPAGRLGSSADAAKLLGFSLVWVVRSLREASISPIRRPHRRERAYSCWTAASMAGYGVPPPAWGGQAGFQGHQFQGYAAPGYPQGAYAPYAGYVAPGFPQSGVPGAQAAPPTTGDVQPQPGAAAGDPQATTMSQPAAGQTPGQTCVLLVAPIPVSRTIDPKACHSERWISGMI